MISDREIRGKKFANQAPLPTRHDAIVALAVPRNSFVSVRAPLVEFISEGTWCGEVHQSGTKP